MEDFKLLISAGYRKYNELKDSEYSFASMHALMYVCILEGYILSKYGAYSAFHLDRLNALNNQPIMNMY